MNNSNAENFTPCLPTNLSNSYSSSKLEESFSSFNSTSEERKNHNKLSILLLDTKSSVMPNENDTENNISNSSIRKYIKFNKSLNKFEVNSQVTTNIMGGNLSNEEKNNFTKFIKDINNYFLENDYINVLKKNKLSKALKVAFFIITLLSMLLMLLLGLFKIKTFSIGVSIIYFTINLMVGFGCFYLFRKIQQHKCIEEYNLFTYHGKNNYRMKKYINEWNEAFFNKKGMSASIPITMEYISFIYTENAGVEVN